MSDVEIGRTPRSCRFTVIESGTSIGSSGARSDQTLFATGDDRRWRGCRRLDDRRFGDGGRHRYRPIFASPRRRAIGARVPHRQLRRNQEQPISATRRAHRPCQLCRRRHDRGANEHRRRNGDLQLRWRRQASNRHWGRRLHRQRHNAGRAGDDRRQAPGPGRAPWSRGMCRPAQRWSGFRRVPNRVQVQTREKRGAQ